MTVVVQNSVTGYEVYIGPKSEIIEVTPDMVAAGVEASNTHTASVVDRVMAIYGAMEAERRRQLKPPTGERIKDPLNGAHGGGGGKDSFNNDQNVGYRGVGSGMAI